MRMLRGLWRSKVVRVEQSLQGVHVVLVDVVIEVVLFVQVFCEGRNPGDHVRGRYAVNVLLQRLADVFQCAVVVDIRQCHKSVPMSSPITCAGPQYSSVKKE